MEYASYSPLRGCYTACVFLLAALHLARGETAAECKGLIVSSVLGTFACCLFVAFAVGLIYFKRYRRVECSTKNNSRCPATVDPSKIENQDGIDQHQRDRSALSEVISNDAVVPLNDAPFLVTHSAPNGVTNMADSQMATVQLKQAKGSSTYGVSLGIVGLFVREIADDCCVTGAVSLVEGDEVLAINGISVSGMTDSEALNILARAGSSVTLDVYKGMYADRAATWRVGRSAKQHNATDLRGTAGPSPLRHPLASSRQHTAVATGDQLLLGNGVHVDQASQRPKQHNPSTTVECRRCSGKRTNAVLNSSTSMPSLNAADWSSDDSKPPLLGNRALSHSTDQALTSTQWHIGDASEPQLSSSQREPVTLATSAFFSDIELARQRALPRPFDIGLSRARFPAQAPSAVGGGVACDVECSEYNSMSLDASGHLPSDLSHTPPPSVPGDDASALAIAMNVSKAHHAKTTTAGASPSTAYYSTAPAVSANPDRQIQIDPDVMREMTLKYSEPRFPTVLSRAVGLNGMDVNPKGCESPSTNAHLPPRQKTSDGSECLPMQAAIELDRMERLRSQATINGTNSGGVRCDATPGSQQRDVYHNGCNEHQRPRSHSSNNDASPSFYAPVVVRNHLYAGGGGGAAVVMDQTTTTQGRSPAPPRHRHAAKLGHHPPRSSSFVKPRKQPKRAHSLPPRQDSANGSDRGPSGGRLRRNGKASQVMFDSLDSINRRKSIDSGTLKKLHCELQANPLLCVEYPILAQLLGHGQTTASGDGSDPSPPLAPAHNQYNC